MHLSRSTVQIACLHSYSEGRQRTYEPNILTAASAMPTKLPGTTPNSSTKTQHKARAVRSAHDEGTLSSEAGAPIHMTLTTLK